LHGNDKDTVRKVLLRREI